MVHPGWSGEEVSWDRERGPWSGLTGEDHSDNPTGPSSPDAAMYLLLALLPLSLARPGVDSCTARLEMSSREGMVVTRSHSCEHRVITRFEGETMLTRVLRLETDVTRSSGLEGSQEARIRVTALDMPATGRVLWEARDQGERAWLWSDVFWVATHFGCCGALDLHTVHSLTTGRTLFHVSGDMEEGLARVEVPNSSLRRYAALFGGGTGYDARVFGDGGALAWITWSSEEEAVQRLAVLPAPGVSRGADDWGQGLAWLPPQDPRDGVSRDGQQVTLWSADGARGAQAVTGLILQVRVAGQRVLQIPVKDGRLDARSAQVPEDLRLVEIPPE